MWELIEVCRSCKSRDLDVVLELKPMPLGNRFSVSFNVESLYPLVLSICEQCGLVQLAHQINTDVIFHESLASWDMSNTVLADDPGLYGGSSPRRKCLYVGGKLDLSSRKDGKYSIDMVPIEEFINRQVNLGRISSQSWGEIINDELLDTLRDEYGEFNEINFDNSSKSAHPLHISNVSDPHQNVERLSSLLAPDGVISVQAPDLPSIINNGHFGYIYHEHQCYFSPWTMRRFFRTLGFRPQKITPAKDGLNMCYRFTRCEKLEVGRSLSVKEKNETETSNKLNKGLLEQFRKRLEMTIERVQRELNGAGGAIRVGYGASVATVTTMYQLAINEKIDFLVDDSEKKCNHYSPRDNLIVRDYLTTSSRDEAMSFIILATRYEDLILKKHPELVGRIITTRMSQ